MHVAIESLNLNWKPDTIINLRHLLSILSEGIPFTVKNFIDKPWEEEIERLLGSEYFRSYKENFYTPEAQKRHVRSNERIYENY